MTVSVRSSIERHRILNGKMIIAHAGGGGDAGAANQGALKFFKKRNFQFDNHSVIPMMDDAEKGKILREKIIAGG